MGYTTFEFYKNSYYGDSIEESLFPKWNDRASEKLDSLTYGNITEAALKMYDQKIQKATCAVADILYALDFKEKHLKDQDGGNVTAMSSGGRSVSYGSKESAVDKVLGDKAAQDNLLFETICEYLTGTGLLYAGVL